MFNRTERQDPCEHYIGEIKYLHSSSEQNLIRCANTLHSMSSLPRSFLKTEQQSSHNLCVEWHREIAKILPTIYTNPQNPLREKCAKYTFEVSRTLTHCIEMLSDSLNNNSRTPVLLWKHVINYSLDQLSSLDSDNVALNALKSSIISNFNQFARKLANFNNCYTEMDELLNGKDPEMKFEIPEMRFDIPEMSGADSVYFRNATIKFAMLCFNINLLYLLPATSNYSKLVVQNIDAILLEDCFNDAINDGILAEFNKGFTACRDNLLSLKDITRKCRQHQKRRTQFDIDAVAASLAPEFKSAQAKQEILASDIADPQISAESHILEEKTPAKSTQRRNALDADQVSELRIWATQSGLYADSKEEESLELDELPSGHTL